MPDDLHDTVHALFASVKEAKEALEKRPFPAYGGKRCVREHDAELEWSCLDVSYWYNIREGRGTLTHVDSNVAEAVDALDHMERLLFALEERLGRTLCPE